MSRPWMADICCKAGGASMGYHMAGFNVVGFDIEPQPNYPFEFHQIDLQDLDPEWLTSEFDAVHASPPCQVHSVTKHLHANPRGHIDLIPEARALLGATELPWVIENVPGAPLHEPAIYCGSSFCLRVRRHRLFESNVPLRSPDCRHGWQDGHHVYRIGLSNSKQLDLEVPYRMSGCMPVFGGTQLNGGNDRFEASVAMGINWMSKEELNQAIPPAYTYHIGLQLMEWI